MAPPVTNLQHYVAVRARRHGYVVRRILSRYANRTLRVLRSVLRINGHLCHLNCLTKFRKDREKHYSFLGVSRSTLLESQFLIVLCRLWDGRERLFIIPSAVLLSRFGEADTFKRFYVPQERVDARWTQTHRSIDWFLYENAWDLLLLPSAGSDASARTG